MPSPASTGRANGLVIGSVGLGSALAPPFITAVMVPWGWRAAMVASAVPALVMAVVWLFVREPAAQTATSRPRAPRTSAVARAEPQLRAVVRLFRAPGFGLADPQLLAPGLRRLHLHLLVLPVPRPGPSLQSGGERGLEQPAVGAVHGLDPARRRHLRSPRRDAPRARVGPAPGPDGRAWAAPASSSPSARTRRRPGSPPLALAVATALVLSVEGAFWTTVAGLAGERSGTGGAIMNTGCNIGGLVSPMLTPVIGEMFGWEPALHVAAGLSILAALAWLRIRPASGGRPAPASRSVIPASPGVTADHHATRRRPLMTSSGVARPMRSPPSSAKSAVGPAPAGGPRLTMTSPALSGWPLRARKPHDLEPGHLPPADDGGALRHRHAQRRPIDPAARRAAAARRPARSPTGWRARCRATPSRAAS